MADRANAVPAKRIALAAAAVLAAAMLNFLLWRNSRIALTPERNAVCFAVDASVSMAGQPLDAVKAAVWQSVYAMRPGTEAALVAFRREAELLTLRTVDYRALTDALTELSAAGGTSISEGLLAAADALSGTTGVKSVILFTDGKNGEERIDAAVAERLSEEEISLFVVGILGTESENLRLVAEETGGSFVTLDEGLSQVLSAVRYRQEAGRSRRFLFAAVIEGAAAASAVLFFPEKSKKKGRGRSPLPNAGYLKREEVKKLL